MRRETATRHRRRAALLLLVGLLATGAGCARRLMLAPAMFHGTAADPFAELPDDQRQTGATLFYATDRNGNLGGPGEDYGVQRGDALLLGRVGVDIGADRNLDWDGLIHRTVGPRGTARPELTFAPADEFGPLLTTAPPRVVRRATRNSQDPVDLQVQFMPRRDPGRAAFRFADALNDEMTATGHAELYVYVHGYFNSFTDALETTASLHHYNGRRGAVIAFSWPSASNLFDYLEDRESAQFAVSDLRQLLIFLAEHTDAQRINLIAHSMGCFLTSNAMRELRLLGFDESPDDIQQRFKIDHVVFVAPDIDADVLQKRYFREGFHHVARRLTLYTSPEDQALRWATRLLYGITRAGSITADYLSDTQRLWLRAHPEVTFVDITGQKTVGLGHAHHTDNPGVASDLMLMLAHDLEPAERGLVQLPDVPIWGFPKGYEEAVQRIAEREYPLREAAGTR
ncbi:MAG: alpha/beta hydrolase [Planctomycetota bacterium]